MNILEPNWKVKNWRHRGRILCCFSTIFKWNFKYIRTDILSNKSYVFEVILQIFTNNMNTLLMNPILVYINHDSRFSDNIFWFSEKFNCKLSTPVKKKTVIFYYFFRNFVLQLCLLYYCNETLQVKMKRFREQKYEKLVKHHRALGNCYYFWPFMVSSVNCNLVTLN